MVRVKICGITNLKDALFCCEHGADALGFVFYNKSPRCITPTAAKKIIKELPPFITVVGMFVNENADVVNRLYDDCRLDVLQFHGDEESSYVNIFKQKKIKAFRIKDSIDIKDIIKYNVDAYLLDAYASGLYGGSGSSFSWNLLQGHKFPKPIILAGGLTPDNVIEAVNEASPYAVDVSSGVEEQKGVKNLDKVKKFLIRAKHGRYEK